MLASDVCLVCVHTEQQSIEALAGEDGLLAVGTKAMADKVKTALGAGEKKGRGGVGAGRGREGRSIDCVCGVVCILSLTVLCSFCFFSPQGPAGWF